MTTKTKNSELTDVTTDAEVSFDPLAAAAIVAQNVEIEDIWLSRLHASAMLAPLQLVGQEFEWRISEPVQEHEFSDKDKLLRVVVSAAAFAVRSTPDAARSKDHLSVASNARLIDLSVSVSLHYRIVTSSPPEEMRRTLFTSFALVNGRYNAWPYIREHFQNITAKMGIPPLVVPVYRVPQKPKQHELDEGRPTSSEAPGRTVGEKRPNR